MFVIWNYTNKVFLIGKIIFLTLFHTLENDWNGQDKTSIPNDTKKIVTTDKKVGDDE